jgi:hypothetical protein
MTKTNVNYEKGLGVCTHFESREVGWKIENLLPVLLDLGATHVRQEIKWEWVEKEKGVFEIPQLSRTWIDAVAQQGLGVIVILNYGNPLYENPLDPDGFAAYARFMAEELRSYPVIAFEIWNEPTNFFFLKQYGGSWSGKGESLWLDKFCELVAKASAAIKAADPKATVITNPGEPQFFHMILKHGRALDHLDGVSHHPYSVRFPAETLPLGGGEISAEDGVASADDTHSFTSLFQYTEAHAQKHLGRSVKLFATEFGFSTYNAYPKPGWMAGYTENAQACYLARAVILCLVSGVQSPCVYDLMDDGVNMTDAEHNFGLIKNAEKGYQKKTAFFTLKRLIAALGTDWEYVGSHSMHIDVPMEAFQEGLSWQKTMPDPFVKIDGPLLYLFKTAGSYVAVLWKAGRINGEKNAPLGRIIWEHAPRVAGVTMEDSVSGESLPVSFEPPPPNGQYRERMILCDVPFRPSPVIVTFDLG